MFQNDFDESKQYLDFVRCVSTFKKYEGSDYNQVGRKMVEYLRENYEYDIKTAQKLVRNAFNEYHMKKDHITNSMIDRNLRKAMDNLEKTVTTEPEVEVLAKYTSTNSRKGGFYEEKYANRMTNVVNNMKEKLKHTRDATAKIVEYVSTLGRIKRLALPFYKSSLATV